MAEDATDEPATVRMKDLVAKARPGRDFAARQALGKLEERLFNRRRDPVRVGRYIIERRLGSGGSGTVYLAYDPQRDRKVALKLLHAGDGDQHDAAQARLLREAQTLTTLNHPNVVKAHDVGVYDRAIFEPAGGASSGGEPGVYVAMEFIEGVTLDKWLHAQPRSWREVREVFAQAGRGLAAAHANALIHRDFKPANVLVSADGPDAAPRAVVLDFGLARATDKHGGGSHDGLGAGARQRLEEAAPIDTTITVPGTLLGTPAYMAPEQHACGVASELSDQYAWCLALYEGWYGHRPFFAETEQGLEEAKLAADVMPPPANTDVPDHLFGVVLKGLAAKPDDRHESMEVLLQALAAPPPRRTRWALLGLAAAAGLAGLVLWDKLPAAPCAADHDALAGVWEVATPDTITSAVAATHRAFAASTAQRVNARLSAHAEAWGEAWTEACAAEPDDPAGPQRRCLLERRDVFGALVRGLATIDAIRVEHAVAASTGLPDPADCVNAELPWYVLGSDAREAAPALARAEASERLGDYPAAIVESGESLRIARTLNRPHAVGLAGLRRGSALGAAGDHDAAVEALADVVWRASGPSHSSLVAAAATRLIELSSSAETLHPDVSLWAQRARDAVVRAAPVQRAATLTTLGWALARAGEPTRALEDLALADELLAATAESPRLEHVRCARARAEASKAAGVEADAVVHLRRAAALAEAVYGADHPETGRVLQALAEARATTTPAEIVAPDAPKSAR